MEKLIFLDVDGVLNNRRWADRMLEEEGISVFHEDMLEPRAIRLLKSIVDETGAKIVVSSAWRKIPRCYENLLKQLSQYDVEVYDVTPYVGGDRGNDITAWFNRNPGQYRYAILDDDSDMGDHMDHLVHTSFDCGITRMDKELCIALLNEEKG